MSAQPPLIPGESTVSFGAVNKLFCVYGDMMMPNTASILDINGTVDVGTLNVTGSSVFGKVTATSLAVNGNVTFFSTGSGLSVNEGGAAPKQGIATLVSGTKVVANTGVTSTSRIFLTTQVPGGGVGSLYVSARTPGTSFAVSSTDVSDTSVFAYAIFEKSN